MSLFQQKYRIESTRLPARDYSRPGFYYVTTCVYKKKCIFGEVVNGTMYLNPYGDIAEKLWVEQPKHYANLVLDEFVIMPNHMHAILQLVDAPTPVSDEMPRRFSVSNIMNGYKSFSAKKINVLADCAGMPVWQSRFHDRVIRNETELNRIRQYIRNNPRQWEMDEMYPGGKKSAPFESYYGNRRKRKIIGKRSDVFPMV
jgi:REP element-mobilizing transposase RayT